MKKEDLILAIGGISCSAAIGFLIGAAVTSSPGKIAAASILGALPAAGVSGFLIDNRATKKLSKVDRALAEKKVELNRLYKLEMKNEELLGDLKYHKAQLQGKRKELEQAGLFANIQSQQIDSLKSNIKKLTRAIASNQEEIDSLNAQLTEWARKYQEDLSEEIAAEVARIKQTNIQQICNEDFSLLKEQRALDNEYRRIILKCREEVRLKSQGCRQAAENYNELLHKFRNQFREESEALRKIIELRETQIQFLQKEKDGELLEPEYPLKTHDSVVRLAGDFCRNLWELSNKQLPLKLEGISGDYNGVCNAGFSYGVNQAPEEIVGVIKSNCDQLCKLVGIHKITRVEKLPIAPVIAVSFRREPAIKDNDIERLVGSPEALAKFLRNNKINYRLMGESNSGKTPTKATLVSHILRNGGHQGNAPNLPKCPHMLVNVSCPGVHTSMKDGDDYPLKPLVKYATEETAHQSFKDAIADIKYREKNPNYAREFFQLWVWDEIDNTVNSSKDKLADSLAWIGKQAGHKSVGWVISGQSLMTSALKGWNAGIRAQFTEIYVGFESSFTFLERYGKEFYSKETIENYKNQLVEIQNWANEKNEITKDKSKRYNLLMIRTKFAPKFFWCFDYDDNEIDFVSISNSEKLSREFKRGRVGVAPQGNGAAKSETVASIDIPASQDLTPDLPMEGTPQKGSSGTKYHCPSCNTEGKRKKAKDRFYCDNPACKQKSFSINTANKYPG